jgi:hypothetical protein
MRSPNCGRETPAGSERCDACGAALSETAAPASAESSSLFAAETVAAGRGSASLAQTGLSPATFGGWADFLQPTDC